MGFLNNSKTNIMLFEKSEIEREDLPYQCLFSISLSNYEIASLSPNNKHTKLLANQQTQNVGSCVSP